MNLVYPKMLTRPHQICAGGTSFEPVGSVKNRISDPSEMPMLTAVPSGPVAVKALSTKERVGKGEGEVESQT